MLLDADVHSRLEWELNIFGAIATGTVPTVISVLRWLVRRGQSNRMAIRLVTQDVAQLKDDWEVRHGKPFPPNPKLPEDLDREFRDKD
jgi:hypothetical protein